MRAQIEFLTFPHYIIQRRTDGQTESCSRRSRMETDRLTGAMDGWEVRSGQRVEW